MRVLENRARATREVGMAGEGWRSGEKTVEGVDMRDLTEGRTLGEQETDE